MNTQVKKVGWKCTFLLANLVLNNEPLQRALNVSNFNGSCNELLSS